MRENAGASLVATIILLLVLSVLGATLASIIVSELYVSTAGVQSEKALHLAEAGVERGIVRVLTDPDWRDVTTTEYLGAGHYTMSATNGAEGGTTITSTGIVDTVRRELEITIFITGYEHAVLSNTDVDVGGDATGIIDGSVHANGSLNGVTVPSEIDYVIGTRIFSDRRRDDLRFDVRNNTGGEVTLTDLTVAWSEPPTAYYETIRVGAYGNVWRWQDVGARASNGQKVAFTRGGDVTIAPGDQVSIRVDNFRDSRTGGGNRVDMRDEFFALTFWAGGASYQTTVHERGWIPDEFVIEGEITQGDAGDPLITMPVIDMSYYENPANFSGADHIIIDGDVRLDGTDVYVQSVQGDTATYGKGRRNTIFYVRGTTTIDTCYYNLRFRRFCLVSEGDITIQTVGPGPGTGIDYVSGSRERRTNEDVIFRVKNNTGAAVQITEFTADWTPDRNAYYEEIRGGGSSLWRYDDPGQQRTGDNETVTLTTPWDLGAGVEAEVRINNFRRRRNGGGNRDMDNRSFLITFRTFGGMDYETTVSIEGEEQVLGNYQLLWYPSREGGGGSDALLSAISTKTGNITESGADDKSKRDINGILFSEQGNVSIENIILDGNIIANYVQLTGDIDIEYVSRFVPDPPPAFLGGVSSIVWTEVYVKP